MFEPSKPKRGKPDDDVIDLDALMRDYGRDSAPLHRAEPLDDAYDTPSKPKRKNEPPNRDVTIRPPRGSLYECYALAHVPDYLEENPAHRSWAALAHLMVVIGIVISFASVSVLMPLAIIISRLIYARSRARSPFLAHHSLQAAVVLTGATLGWWALMIASTLGAMIFSGAMPLLLALVPIMWLAFALVPIGAFFFGFAGIAQALQGRTFRYPYRLFLFGVATHEFFPTILRAHKLIG